MKIAILQICYTGDLINVLPLARHLSQAGHTVDLYCSADYAPVLEGVSYINVREMTIGYLDVDGALQRINRDKYDKILVTQTQGYSKCRKSQANYALESWAQAGVEYLPLYHEPLVFDRRNKLAEQKLIDAVMPDNGDSRPILAFSLTGNSSKCSNEDAVQRWILSEFSDDFRVVNIGMGRVACRNPHNLLGLIEKASVFIATDSAPLHLSYAVGTPTIALQPDDAYQRSERRAHWVEAVKYSEAMTVEGRARIIAAAPRPHKRLSVLPKMKAPGDVRPGVWRGRILQVKVTNACDLDCKNCSVGVGLAKKLKKRVLMTPGQFRESLRSLRGFPGVIGMFGGNPCIHPQFEELCAIFRQEIPNKEQRGLWSNNLFGHGKLCRETFHGPHCNLNVHQSQKAWDEIVRDWPEARLIHSGLQDKSMHGPIFGSMTELGLTEAEMWRKVSTCYVNQTWSAEITVVDGQLVGYFCEIAATMAELTGDASKGTPIAPGWWQQTMPAFEHQVMEYCTKCLIPMNARKVDAGGDEPEEYSAAWAPVMTTVNGRPMRLVASAKEIEGDGSGATKYLPQGVFVEMR